MTAVARGPVHLHAIKQGNLGAVLRELMRAPGSRAEIAQRTGLTKATVANLIEPLLTNEVLDEDPPATGARGRPARPLRFHPGGPVAIGAEIGVGYLAATVTGLDGEPRSRVVRELDTPEMSPGELCDELIAATESLLAQTRSAVLGLGLAVPGIVHRGRVVRAPNLPAVLGWEPGPRLVDTLRLERVLIDNEANTAAWANLWPRPTAGADFAYISGGIGVGAGLVMNGGLYRGPRDFAGEFGHVVIERHGHPCGCGGRGCVEQYAGIDALLRAAGAPDVRGLCDALEAGRAAAVRAVADAGSALGVAIASLVNLCDVPVVVLGGAYSDIFDQLQPAVAAELTQRVLANADRPTLLRPSERGGDSAVVGAACLVTHYACTHPDGLRALVAHGAGAGSR